MYSSVNVIGITNHNLKQFIVVMNRTSCRVFAEAKLAGKERSAVCLFVVTELPDVYISSRVISRHPDLRSKGSANLDH